ncbi:sensor histidine kinase [Amycolatopsis sp.]|uniref:sensor histidine kinase n=1 Tax=Amycolatopsis sp. TaxID=37632 RepID=UPI002D80E691|nr:histidine kinase [Amycolatopsis sp.]HET6707642.1 histidine kinase [Amycolatopsis sp.]
MATDHPPGPRPWHRLARLSRTPAGDLLITATAAVVVLFLGSADRSVADPLATAVAAAAVASPLLLRRRFPLGAALACAAVAGAVVVAGIPLWPGRLVAMAAFASAAYHRPRVSVLCWSVGWLVVLAFAGVRPATAATYTDLVLLGVAPVAAGYALRLHRDRAEHAAHLYRAETRRAVAEEHARVAREVHDAVGHHLTVIRLQATAVRHVLRALPPAADRALATIADASAAALTEVRAVLPRNGSSLSDLDTLVERTTGPDRTVTLTRRGSPDVPPLLDHAGYRMAQEALTNVLRHSDATRVHVGVDHCPDAVVITVADNGSTTPGAPAEGSGLRGMRERARLLGGTVRIEPGEPTGWRVEARLPR